MHTNKNGTWQSLDAPLIPGALDNGIIPIELLSKPLLVELKVWPGARPGYTYQLMVNGKLTGPEKVITNELPGALLTLDIPNTFLNEGLYNVGYRTKNPFSELTDDSDTTPIQIDRTAPGNPLLGPIIFPSAISDGLTSAELESMGDVLKGQIASYGDMKEGDVIRSYWGSVEGPLVIVDKDDMGLKRVEVSFTRLFLESIGDIEASVYYTVTDLAGNLSMASEAVPVQLQLMVLPELPLPIVREATGNVLDPADAINGATAVVAASAELRSGDHVLVQWTGPKGSDHKDRIITASEAGKELALLFSAALVDVNRGQTVAITYTVRRASGSEQTSEILSLQIRSGLAQLPAPVLDTVGSDGILTPSKIPESGATVRVSYAEMSTGDTVFVSWKGASAYDTPVQVVGGDVELQFNVPKAFINQSIGASASVTYTVTRAGTALLSAPLWLQVDQGLVFDGSPVTLAGKVYLIPGSPDLLPAFPANTTIKRAASGGQAPYSYSSSDEKIAHVDAEGLASVRGNGAATITVTDASGDAKSYPLTVTGVVHCDGLGSGKFSQISATAASHGLRIPSIDELNQIFNTYGNRWPMGNALYWSSTVAAQNLLGWKWYFNKNLVTGANFKVKEHHVALGVGIR